MSGGNLEICEVLLWSQVIDAFWCSVLKHPDTLLRAPGASSAIRYATVEQDGTREAE